MSKGQIIENTKEIVVTEAMIEAFRKSVFKNFSVWRETAGYEQVCDYSSKKVILDVMNAVY